MSIRKVENALDLLIFYNTSIRRELQRMADILIFLQDYERKEEERQERYVGWLLDIQKIMLETLTYLKKEEIIETLVLEVDQRIALELRRDILELKRIIEAGKNAIEKIKKDPNPLQKENGVMLSAIHDQCEKIFAKDVYLEILLKEVLSLAQTEWEKNIKEKTAWLYHGTSVLFLPYIQKSGLDSTKLPLGIKRGINTLAALFSKYGLNKSHYFKGGRDLWSFGGKLTNLEYLYGGVNFTWNSEHINSKSTGGVLPEFLYERFDENVLQEEPAFRDAFVKMENEDQRMFFAIMRFGRILRAKNKVILLKILVNAEFIKYLGFSDFITDFDTFYREYLVKRMGYNSIFEITQNRRTIVTSLCSDLQIPFTFFAQQRKWPDFTGMRITTPIPPKFIYLDLKKGSKYSTCPISEWNEKAEPLFQ